MNIYDFILISFCVLWIVSEIIFNRIKMLKDSANKYVKKDNSLKIIWFSVMLSVIISAILSDVLNIGNIIKYELFLITIGLLLIIIGVLIKYKAASILKNAYSVNLAVLKNQKIIKEWWYKKIRHPGYLGMLISFIGLSISFRNVYAIIIVLVINISSLINRIFVEEKMMKEHFGKDYEEYCKETNRLIYKIY